MALSEVQPSSTRSLFPRIQQWLQHPENRLLLLLLLLVFPLYYELGRTPVQLYDESRVAVNTTEMLRNGHWLVPHYDGAPDHWNTKPPLLIWLQVLSLKLFGISAWALRLPTLLASLGTVLLLFRFATRVLRRPWAGVLAGVILVTTTGFVRLHVARTADYDALLIFWQVLLWVHFFQYLETGARRHLLWVALSVLLATLTKGPAALLGLPGLAVYALGRGKLLWLLRQPGVYLAAVVWLAVMATYFLVREPLDPGYWEAVQNNDLGGRFLTTLDNHVHPWDFYLENFRQRFFAPWLWALLPALVVAGILQPAGLVKRAAWMLVLFCLSWLGVISSAQSKLEWYDAPIYPALALLLGLGLSIAYQDLRELYRPRVGRVAGVLAQVLLIGCVVLLPYYAITTQLIAERHSDFGLGPDGHLGRYITRLAREQPQVNNVTVLTHGMANSMLLYYKAEFEQHAGNRLTILNEPGTRTPPLGSVVVTCDPAFKAPLDSAFRMIEVHQNGSCQTLLLLSRLPSPGVPVP
ncbi:ArnT family glycosyltransferase [Hymenobacter endophyticus]|uniref:Glycosyltransferase family 39 protein n=1 Tax=Hymenobacter endophyticus TaxID=3076335 RepID=A0ABU3TH62_9BACT|nr:glycosyltransferase family 39 protein [Hymenobacter endophyticus]MDU0370685.1 glycosyltransferase family 39 protein [Hymenobacter endophyticus]